MNEAYILVRTYIYIAIYYNMILMLNKYMREIYKYSIDL